MRRLIPAALLLLAPVTLSGTAFADDNASPADAAQTAVSLPEKVVTATRVPTLAERIPAGVTVIDRKTIEERGYTTLADALAAVPGMNVVQSGGPGGNASVFMRGTDSNHVLVLRDGAPINDPSNSTGAFNFGVDTLEDVDRIEVVRGPMSGEYGSGAVGGVINIITRKGESGTHGSAEIAGGLPRAGEASGNINGKQGIVDYSLTAGTQSTIGFDSTPKRMTGVYTGERDGERTQLVDINLGVTPVPGTRFFGDVRYRESVFGLDESGWPNYDAPNDRGYDRSLDGHVGVTSTLFDGVWETGLTLGHLDTRRSYLEPLEAADPNGTASYSRYLGQRDSVAWNNTIHLPDYGPASATALTLGVDHKRDSANVLDQESAFGYSSVDTSVAAHAENTAGHAGLQSTLFDRLTLSGSVREEDATYGGNAFTWRTGGVLAVPEMWSRFKLSYGTSFLAPSLYDLFGADSSYGFVGNRNLKPEKSEGWEGGWAVDLPFFARRDGVTVDVTYFSNRVRNLIETEYVSTGSGGYYTPENLSSAHMDGVESTLTLRPGKWAEAVIGWTYTDAHAADGSRLLRRPKHQASFTLVTHPIERLTIAPELVYRSGAADYIYDNDGFETGEGITSPGIILNMTASYKLTDHFSLFFNGYNLTNSRYEAANGYQMPGAHFLTGLRGRF